MTKKYYSLGIILLLILEVIICYIFQRQYADIMGASNITIVYSLAIFLNLLILAKTSKTAQTIKLLSALLLIFSPLYLYINKPEYSVDSARSIIDKRFNNEVIYRHSQIYEDSKVYVFYSEQKSNLYFFNPYNGESGVLEQ